MILLVNQFITPVFLDVANAFAQARKKVLLFTGSIDAGNTEINSAIRIVNSVRYRRRSKWSRLASWMFFTLHLAVHLIFHKRPKSILVVTNPPLGPWLVYHYAKWKKISYYLLVYDLYPEALDQGGFASSQSMIYKKWKSVNFKVFQGAEKVFTLSDSMKEAVARYVNPDSIKVISNWVDPSYIQPLPKESNPFIRKYSLEGKIVVLYSGNMGFTHDLESLVEAALLLQEEKSLRLILIGEGGKRARLEELCRKKGIKNVLFLPYQNSTDFPLAMAAADIGVVTLGVGAEGISVPSKTYVNMAAGLCLLTIAPKNSELSRIVEEHKIGLISEPGNPVKVAEHIRFLHLHPDKLKEFKTNSRLTAYLFTPRMAFEYVKEVIY